MFRSLAPISKKHRIADVNPPPLPKSSVSAFERIRRWRWLIFATGIAILIYGLFGLERNLRAYSRLCAGEEKSYYEQVREFPTSGEAEDAAYAYWANTPLPAKTSPAWISWISWINVVDKGPYRNPSDPHWYNRRPNSIYGFRHNGVLYLNLYKSLNFSAGICIAVLPNSSPLQTQRLTVKPIPDSKWMIWKYNDEA